MYWCLLTIVGVTIIGAVICQSVRKITNNGHIVAHVDTFIGNLWSGVYAMELGIIARSQGKYSISLLVAGFLHLFFKFWYFNRFGGFQNPLSFIASYYDNGRRIRFSLFFAASIIVTQFAALYYGQLLARAIWAFEDQIHVDGVNVACTSAMSSSYSLLHIALLEGLGTLLGVFVNALTPPPLKEASGAFLTMTLYFFFTHISGSFFNPIIATAFSFRCAGHTSDWEHVAVYWVAPALAMVIALEIISGVDRVMKGKVPEKVD